MDTALETATPSTVAGVSVMSAAVGLSSERGCGAAPVTATSRLGRAATTGRRGAAGLGAFLRGAAATVALRGGA